MKYEILFAFREYLENTCTANTAKRYYYIWDKLLSDQQFNRIEEINFSRLIERIKVLKTRNEISAAKNALKHFGECFSGFSPIPDEMFKALSLKAAKGIPRHGKELDVKQTLHKINAVRDEKLRLALRLILASGARVSEAATLEKKDISIDGDRLEIEIRHGKGGSNGIVTCRVDPYLTNTLPGFLADFAPDERPFYSAKTLKEKAHNLGLECHDLRRIAAQLQLQEVKKEEKVSQKEAQEATRKFLRHKSFKTTSRYLTYRPIKKEKKEDSDE